MCFAKDTKVGLSVEGASKRICGAWEGVVEGHSGEWVKVKFTHMPGNFRKVFMKIVGREPGDVQEVHVSHLKKV